MFVVKNSLDTLDHALIRHGRFDRKITFGLPDMEGNVAIFKTYTKPVTVAKEIHLDLLAPLCPNATGADTQCLSGVGCLPSMHGERSCLSGNLTSWERASNITGFSPPRRSLW